MGGGGNTPKVLTPEEIRKRELETNKKLAEKKKKDAMPMNQASKLLSSMKEIAEIKQSQLELQDNKVVQYVPDNQRKEWNDSFTRHLTNLMAHRNDLESRVAVAEPKAFDKAGGKKALELTRADVHKAGLDLKAWRSTYNVYMNAST